MDVTDVEVTPVVAPLERPVEGSHYRKESRGTAVVTLRTDGGVSGTVYSASVLDEGRRGRTFLGFLCDELAPVVEGTDVFSVESTWESMFALTERFMPSRIGDRSLFMHAIGAIDAALWDAVGKAAGVPLYRLWGGHRDAVPVVGIGGYYEDGKTDEDLVEEVREYERMGLSGVKLKVGGRSVERDLERLAAVREATGRGFAIAPDANRGYTVDEAVAFAEGASEHGIEWFEEPVVWHEQYRGMREVRRRTGVPVAAGQSEMRAAGCARLLEEEAVDVLNFDALLGCGPTEWRRAAVLARQHGVAMAHHEQPHVAMHLLAAVPDGRAVEVYHPDVDPLWYGHVANRPPFEDGHIGLPDDPGLGIEIDRSFVERHRVDP